MPVEPRDLQRPPRLEPGGDEQECAAVRQPRSRLDQHTEARRIDERHARELDHEPLGLALGGGDQLIAHEVRVVEIELADEPDDDGSVALLD